MLPLLFEVGFHAHSTAASYGSAATYTPPKDAPGIRTPDMVQELMCGQRQAPMLPLASRRGGNRRVVECLPEIVDGGVYGDAGRENDSEHSRKSSTYY